MLRTKDRVYLQPQAAGAVSWPQATSLVVPILARDSSPSYFILALGLHPCNWLCTSYHRDHIVLDVYLLGDFQRSIGNVPAYHCTWRVAVDHCGWVRRYISPVSSRQNKYISTNFAVRTYVQPRINVWNPWAGYTEGCTKACRGRSHCMPKKCGITSGEYRNRTPTGQYSYGTPKRIFQLTKLPQNWITFTRTWFHNRKES